MNIDSYNRAIDKLAFYTRMAVLAEKGTPAYTTYIDKLQAGISILSIAYDKSFDEVESDARKAYESKYRCYWEREIG